MFQNSVLDILIITKKKKERSIEFGHPALLFNVLRTDGSLLSCRRWEVEAADDSKTGWLEPMMEEEEEEEERD